MGPDHDMSPSIVQKEIRLMGVVSKIRFEIDRAITSWNIFQLELPHLRGDSALEIIIRRPLYQLVQTRAPFNKALLSVAKRTMDEWSGQ